MRPIGVGVLRKVEGDKTGKMRNDPGDAAQLPGPGAAAEMKDLVTRAISEHATEQMQQHCSTVDQTEMRQRDRQGQVARGA